MTPEEQLVVAVQHNDLDAATRTLALHPELKRRLNDPLPGLPFDATIMQPAVRWQNREMIALLQMAGADINTKTHWWAGGFSVLDFAEPAFVPFLLERGAKMTIHAAARLGDIDEVRRILRANKNAVNARGGDGQTPLHVASTIDVAALLLDYGADVDAKDVDHESTPAQYRVGDHPEVARYLVSRGATVDIFLASALGDADRARSILDADPTAIHAVVDEKHFPMKNRRAGGHIYIWTIGKYKTPHAAAHDRGHAEVLRVLLDRSPRGLALAVTCRIGDEVGARALLAVDPTIVASLSPEEQATLPNAARDGDLNAVRVLLDAGWPIDARGEHGGTALHWAAFHGNAAMTLLLLSHHPDLSLRDADHDGAVVDWALHGSEHGWSADTGDYVGTVAALLDAGAENPDSKRGSQAVRREIERRNS